MSFLSGVSSIVSNVGETVVGAVGAAADAASRALGIVEDTSVTDALAGEVDNENAGLDTFNSTSTQAKDAAQQADANQKTAEENKLSAEERIVAADAKIAAADTEIASCTTQLEELKALQAAQNASSESTTGTKDETKQDYSQQIAAVQAQLTAAQKAKAEAEAEKAEAEAELGEAETDIETAKAEGADAESNAQSSADGGNATAESAEGTEASAETAVTEAETEKAEEEAAEQSGTSEQPAEAATTEGQTTTNEGSTQGETGYTELSGTTTNNAETSTTVVNNSNYSTSDSTDNGTSLEEHSTSAATTPSDTTTNTEPETGMDYDELGDYLADEMQGENQDPNMQNPGSDSMQQPNLTPEEEVHQRIENNEETDAEMADVIINDMFEGESLEIGTEELIGMAAHDAVEVASETFKTKLYSTTVYSTAVSTSTDTATVEENQEAIADFMEAYSITSDKINAPNVEFLSLTDKSNYENATRVQERLNNGEYILTREIEKSTATVQSIQVSTDETVNQKEEMSKTKGQDLLRQLEAVITTDETIQEDKNDDVLTQKEYDEIENFFNNTDDTASYYKEMVEEAKKYGIYTEANAIAA